MRIRKELALLCFVVLLAGLFVGGMSSATADSSELAPTPPATSEIVYDFRPQLEQLVGTQAAEEIEEIVNSGRRNEALYDPAQEKFVAAMYVDEGLFSPFALTGLGPGCSTTSLCMSPTSGVPHGYIGTGALNGTWRNIVRFYAGNRTSGYRIGSSAVDWAGAGTGVWFPNPGVTINRIERR